MKEFKAVNAHEAGTTFCEALGIDPGKVRCIIIDINANDPMVAAYVQMIGNENAIDGILDAFERLAEEVAG